MPDQERTIQVLVTMPVFGNEEQANQMAVSIARAIHYGVKPGATIERVDVRDETFARTLVPFDAVLDDGHEPPGYISLSCTCRYEGVREAVRRVWVNPDCPQHSGKPVRVIDNSDILDQAAENRAKGVHGFAADQADTIRDTGA